MKSLWSKKAQKRGVASLYVVIFATMVFGVIALSCMRVMLSEVSQSGDDDLSRSAYDAAMAGVEDAKTAINRYYTCLSSGGGGDCDTNARSVLFKNDCDTSIGVAEYLYHQTANSDGNSEILVQENNKENGSDQAYTCVIVSDVVPDYRGTLTTDTKTKVVPLGVNAVGNTVDGGDASSDLGSVKRIQLKWYSYLNEGDETGGSQGFVNLTPNKSLKDANHATIPPTLSVTLIRVSDSISISNLHKASSGADYSSVVLLPNNFTSSEQVKRITKNQLEKAGDALADKHEPIEVTCSTTSEFACAVDLEVDFDSHDSAFLVVSLPYGEKITDFAVAMYSSENNADLIKFKGAQLSVDSTGRTNQLFRRVETRLEPSDLYFPYPQYALDLGGGGDGGLTKNFWITANCWYSHKVNGANAGGTCNNNDN